MRPSWQPSVEVVALGEVPNGPTVDLKIETQIPSKVRGPQNDGRRPPGWASAVPIKTAKIKVRIKKKLAAELYFDFMAYGNPGFVFR